MDFFEKGFLLFLFFVIVLMMGFFFNALYTHNRLMNECISDGKKEYECRNLVRCGGR